MTLAQARFYCKTNIEWIVKREKNCGDAVKKEQWPCKKADEIQKVAMTLAKTNNYFKAAENLRTGLGEKVAKEYEAKAEIFKAIHETEVKMKNADTQNDNLLNKSKADKKLLEKRGEKDKKWKKDAKYDEMTPAQKLVFTEL